MVLHRPHPVHKHEGVVTTCILVLCICAVQTFSRVQSTRSMVVGMMHFLGLRLQRSAHDHCLRETAIVVLRKPDRAVPFAHISAGVRGNKNSRNVPMACGNDTSVAKAL